MLTKFKKRVQSWLVTEARAAKRIGLTPNGVSFIGIFLAFASGASYWISGLPKPPILNSEGLVLLGSLLLLASGFCDALDGVLARVYGEATTLGGFLDSLLDRYADASVYYGLIMGGLCDLQWGLVALIGSILVSYSRARAEAAGVPMETVGLVERAERILMIVIAGLVNPFWRDSLRWTVILLAFLTNFTVIQRVTYFYKNVSRRG